MAGSDALGETFIVPIKDVLECVREKHGASKVCFPTKEDSLWLAVYFGNATMVERLLKAFDGFLETAPQVPIHDLEFRQLKVDNMTMLHWAANKGYRLVLEMLVEAGGNVNLTTETMKTSLHLASHLSSAEASVPEIVQRKLGIIEFLLTQEGIDVNATDQNGNTPAMVTEQSGFEAAREIFEKHSKLESKEPTKNFAHPSQPRTNQQLTELPEDILPGSPESSIFGSQESTLFEYPEDIIFGSPEHGKYEPLDPC